MGIAYFYLTSDVFSAWVPRVMSPTCKTNECVIETANKVEELICIYYDIYHSDPRES